MRILRYIIFLSILSSIFVVIYSSSNERGFRRLRVSIKMALFTAATLAGLIPVRVQASENDSPYNLSLTPIERNIKSIRV